MPLRKVAAPLEETTEGRFLQPKNCRGRVELVKGEYSKVNSLQNKWAVKVFREWIASRVEVLVLDLGGAFKYYCDLHKVQPLSAG